MNEGLTGMQVSAIAANDYGLFAATLDAGVFASVNDGLSWTPVNNGLVNPEIHSITARGNELFIGTMGDGIFRSVNNGAEWIPFNNGMTIPYITSLCTVGDKVFTGTMGGLYRLDQGAGTWISVNEGLLDDVLSYAVYNDLLFIGTNGSGVFYTPDNGLSWIKCNEGFSTKTIYSLAICGANIFAGQCCGNGLWKRPLEECVGISEISDPFHVILYPVPVGEFFYVGIPGEEFDGRGHLSIFSLDGTRVKETELAGLKTSVETGGLTPGSYIVRIRMEDKTVIRKITKIDTR
jgi:hypothetical protein